MDGHWQGRLEPEGRGRSSSSWQVVRKKRWVVALRRAERRWFRAMRTMTGVTECCWIVMLRIRGHRPVFIPEICLVYTLYHLFHFFQCKTVPWYVSIVSSFKLIMQSHSEKVRQQTSSSARPNLSKLAGRPARELMQAGEGIQAKKCGGWQSTWSRGPTTGILNR